MNDRRTSTVLATIALAIAATLCASDASACSASKADGSRSCCARKQRPARDCCKKAVPAAASPETTAADSGSAVSLPNPEAPACECGEGRPDAPAETDEGRVPPRVESHLGFVASHAIPADRPATDVAVGLARIAPADGSSIYLRSSRLLL